MVRMMLRAHEGDLRVTSAVGKGTTLKFWLKAKLANESPLESNAANRLSH